MRPPAHCPDTCLEESIQCQPRNGEIGEADRLLHYIPHALNVLRRHVRYSIFRILYGFRFYRGENYFE